MSSIFTSCSTPKQLVNGPAYKNARLLFYAWNEDTLNSYLFTAYTNNRFYYKIRKVDSAGNESIQTFRGKIQYATDKLYLSFKPENSSTTLNPYLVKEISGHYLIQTFNSQKDRYFLRIIDPRRLLW